MTKPMWTADIEIDTALAGRLVAEQFPQFARASVVPFGSGWDNAAFLIGGHTVFRFPRRRVAIALLAREIAILPHLAPQLPLRISAPRFIGAESDAFPRPFAGYERIEGETACSVTLSEDERASLAEPLARFLRALHGLDSSAFLALGIPGDEIGRLDHTKRLPATRERLLALGGAEAVETPDLWLAWLEANPPVPLAAARRSIVHGDLYAARCAR